MEAFNVNNEKVMNILKKAFILKSNDIVILKNHGFIAIGHTLEDAFSKIKSFA